MAATILQDSDPDVGHNDTCWKMLMHEPSRLVTQYPPKCSLVVPFASGCVEIPVHPMSPP